MRPSPLCLSRLSLSKYDVLCHVNVRHLKSAVTWLMSYHDPVEMCTVRHTVTQWYGGAQWYLKAFLAHLWNSRGVSVDGTVAYQSFQITLVQSVTEA